MQHFRVSVCGAEILVHLASSSRVIVYGKGVTNLYVLGDTTHINCGDNSITSLVLRHKMGYVSCVKNPLRSINIANKISVLDVSDCKLTSLTVPDTLTCLSCRNNNISELVLGDNVQTLDASGNKELISFRFPKYIDTMDLRGCTMTRRLDVRDCKFLLDVKLERTNVEVLYLPDSFCGSNESIDGLDKFKYVEMPYVCLPQVVEITETENYKPVVSLQMFAIKALIKDESQGIDVIRSSGVPESRIQYMVKLITSTYCCLNCKRYYSRCDMYTSIYRIAVSNKYMRLSVCVGCKSTK